MSAENLALTGIRSPHHPTRSQSLYRLLENKIVPVILCPPQISQRLTWNRTRFSAEFDDENQPELHLKSQSVPRSNSLRLGYTNQSINVL